MHLFSRFVFSAPFWFSWDFARNFIFGAEANISAKFCCDYMTNFSPGWNIRKKMMELHKAMMELKRNLPLAAYLSARKTYLQRKRRNQARRVRRKPRSVWVINGRTDQWWQNMIGEDVPDWCWRKNFRMSKECFISFILLKSLVAAAISFPGKQNHCACPSSLFSPGWNSVSITWYFFQICRPVWPGWKS